MFDRDAYLERIGFGAHVRTSEDGLEAIHRAQVYSIPFENFDIALGRGISVDPADIFQKTVARRRGGYCFELNGLFLQALAAFGFEARALLARVHMGPEPSGRTHQISLVVLDGREWIADVGFGALSLRRPMPLELDRSVDQDGIEYRLVAAEPWGTLLQARLGGDWLALYSFDRSHVCRADIETGNHFTATSPRSFFTQMHVAALATPEGRNSLANQTLTQVRHGESSESQLASGPAYLEGLRQHFGIELDAAWDDLAR